MVESNMFNDKRIKSCLSRFNSGAYTVACSFCVQSAIQPALIRSPYTAAGRQQQQQQQRGRRRGQAGARASSDNFRGAEPATTSTTVAKCASWRHVLASHWCRADMRGSVKRVLCVCQL